MRKTSTTLGALKILQAEGVFERALVIAPKRVCEVTWPDEIEKWTDFAHFRWALLRGGAKDDWVRADADIFLINPEGLEWLLTVPRIIKDSNGDDCVSREIDFTKFKELGVDTLIVDESTKFKNTQAKRFKYLKPFLGKFARRWILTGTPKPKGYMDLFPQMYICDMGATLGTYITYYRKKYFVPSGYGGYGWKLKDGAEKLIVKAVKPHVMRLDAEDYIKLPTLMDNPILFNLPPKARKIYEGMEDEMFSQFDRHKITAISGSISLMKCEQIASGAIYKDKEIRVGKGKGAVIDIHEEKIDMLKDLIEQQQGNPLLILYWFNHEGDRLLKALGKEGAHLGSGVGAREARGLIHAWNNDQLPWLIGHPASMGHGLNLQEGSANALAWYTLPWSYELYEQTWRRLVRSGSRHSVIMNHMLTARDTVDVIKIRVLRSRGAEQKAFLDAVKQYRRGDRRL